VTIQGQRGAAPGPSTKSVGDQAEQLALDHLRQHGLRLLQRNFRTPGRGGGEVDLIMRDTDGTVVFVEVRYRRASTHGGAGGSIGWAKQRRIVFAARHYLARCADTPACRFDAVLVQGPATPHGSMEVSWVQAAFDTSGW
jgi:putative endonuclease